MRALFGWFRAHSNSNSAFTVDGECKQIYLNQLADEHAKYIMMKALELQQDKEVRRTLKLLQEDIQEEEHAKYDDGEMDEINDIIDSKPANAEKISIFSLEYELLFSRNYIGRNLIGGTY
jgi:hypothetical protein